MRRIAFVPVIVAAMSLLPIPAYAVDSTQTISASLGSSLSVTTAPTSSVSGWALASTGANTTSGGSIGINSNVAYTIALTADKASMSEWNGSAYVSSGKTLASPLSIVSSRTGGTAVTPGVAGTAIVGSVTALATGTGLGTDTYGLTLSQPTVITDSALQTNTYRMVLTYTSAAVF